VWTNASGRHYKKNIVSMRTYGLATVMAMNPVEYEMKTTGEKQVGFIAQDMKKILPEVVYGVDGKMTLSYGNVVAVTVKAIQQLKALFEIDHAAITKLQADNANLRAEFESYKRAHP
jgi:hypothetical protein